MIIIFNYPYIPNGDLRSSFIYLFIYDDFVTFDYG